MNLFPTQINTNTLNSSAKNWLPDYIYVSITIQDDKIQGCLSNKTKLRDKYRSLLCSYTCIFDVLSAIVHSVESELLLFQKNSKHIFCKFENFKTVKVF